MLLYTFYYISMKISHIITSIWNWFRCLAFTGPVPVSNFLMQTPGPYLAAEVCSAHTEGRELMALGTALKQ